MSQIPRWPGRPARARQESIREGEGEAILHLRCIEVTDLWDDFFDWCQNRWCEKPGKQEKVTIRTDKPIDLPEAA